MTTNNLQKQRSSIPWILLIGIFLLAATVGGLTTANIISSIGFTTSTNSFRQGETDPLSEHYGPTPVAAVTNGADAGGGSCPAGTDYCYYIDMDSYRKLGLQLILDCVAGTVTATVEATMQTGCAPAACTYEDVTNDTFGVASLISAAAPATDMWVDNAEKTALYKYIMIRIAAATGGNTGDWTIYASKLY